MPGCLFVPMSACVPGCLYACVCKLVCVRACVVLCLRLCLHFLSVVCALVCGFCEFVRVFANFVWGNVRAVTGPSFCCGRPC